MHKFQEKTPDVTLAKTKGQVSELRKTCPAQDATHSSVLLTWQRGCANIGMSSLESNLQYNTLDAE